MVTHLSNFTDVLGDEIENSQPLSFPSSNVSEVENEFHRNTVNSHSVTIPRPAKGTGQKGDFRSIEEIDPKYRHIFTYPYFNLVQSRVIDDALYTDKSIVVSAPTGSGKTVIFEMAIVQLLMEMDDKQWQGDFKVIYMAPVKSLCTERLTEWYPKFTKLGHLCIEVTGDTDVDFQRLEPYKIIITTPEKWDMLTRRWRDHRGLVELIKLFLIDEVHILNDECRGPVLEAVVSRMKTIQESAQSAHRIEQLTKQYQSNSSQSSSICNELALKNNRNDLGPKIRFVAVSATVSNPEDVAAWLGSSEKCAVYYKFGDETRPVKLRRVVEGYPCPDGTSIFKFDIILNYKLWPIIQKYNDGKPTLIFCNTRKSVAMTAETLSKELTVSFSPEQKAKLVTLASTFKNKKLQSLVLSGVGCHHAGLLYEERVNIENSFRNRELPILITTTTLAMGVNLPAHLVIIKNTQQYVNGAYQEYSISTVLQMVGRAGRPQFDTEATAVIMTTLKDKPRYQSLVGGSDPLQSYLHKRIAENLNSEAALGTVTDVAQCVQWLRSTFLYVRAGKDPRRYLGLPHNAPAHQITKKIEELCVKAMNGLATSGLITMDEASCIESTEAGKLMSVYYLDVETMKHIMKINGDETLDQLLWLVCESHELSDNHLRMDERRTLNSLNRNTKAATIRFPMKGKITTRQMKLNCIIQAVLGCLQIPEPSLHQEAMKIMRIAERVCKCLLAYVIRPDLTSNHPKYFFAILNAILLNKCICSHLWENSPYVSRQLRGIGPTFSTLLASAGKTSFMLLEESHPRDLERIMNKGPPAGNIIRKQVALLPKYHVTAIPVDANTVCFKLLLINQAHLSENIDNLTAGANHKTYIIIGDSDNHLLLLTSFKDKDLIGMYDGTITHEISRRSGNEHKIHFHCISTVFVGIDVQCEYVFQEIEPLFNKDDLISYPPFEGELPETPKFIQPSIANIFKERKRKNNVDITQSKEKKKRDSALIEKLKQLKDNFGVASKQLKDDLNQTTELSTSLVNEFNKNSSNFQTSTDINDTTVFNNKEIEKLTYHEINDLDFDGDETICDDEFNDILNNIEKEIHKSDSYDTKKTESTYFYTPEKSNIDKKRFKMPSNNRKLMTKSNYNFIDEIDHKNSKPEENENTSETGKGLPDSIKTHIAKYLQNQTVNKHVDNTLTEIINNSGKEEVGFSNVSKTTCTTLSPNITHLKVQDIKIDAEKEVIKPQKSNFVDITDSIVEMDANDNVNVVSDEVFKNDVTTHTSNKQAVEFNEPTMDSNVIEINSDSEDDITQLLTQKVLSLPSSPEKNHLSNHLQDVKNTEENAFSASNSDEKSIGRNDLPEINFSNETGKRSIIPYSVKDIELTEMPTHITEPVKCNLQILAKQEDLKLDGQTTSECKDLLKENKLYTKSYFKENTYASSNICSENRPENEITNLEQKIINQYSFTHTGINVASKDLPDRKIHVVKRVRIDLDITEVVTKPMSNCNRSNQENTTLAPVSYQSAPIQMNNQEYIDTTKNVLPIEYTNPSSKEFTRPETFLMKWNKSYSESSYNVEDTDGNKQNNSVKIVIDERVKNPVNYIEASKKILVTERKEDTHKCLNNDDNNESKDQQTLMRNEQKHEDKSSIANILQKYSNLLHPKSENINMTPNINKEDIIEKEILQTVEQSSLHNKPKRCYKISDIENDRVPLPEGINQIISSYSKPPENLVANDVILDKVINLNKKVNYPTTSNCRDNTYETGPISKDGNQNQLQELSNLATDSYNNDMEINDFKSPSFTKLQLSNVFDDFKIEPAMLDPKTLLQSYNTDSLVDLIIPPPPDFSEDVNQSTDNFQCNPVMHTESQENEDDLSTCIDSDNTQYFPEDNEILQYSNNTSFGPKPFHKEIQSPFHSKVNSPVHDYMEDINNRTLHELDLTPTKEVETWILPVEDCAQEPRQSVSRFSLAPNKSRSQPENNFQRLQSFKFRPKSQLRSSNLSQPLRSNFKRKWPTVRRNNFR